MGMYEVVDESGRKWSRDAMEGQLNQCQTLVIVEVDICLTNKP